VTYRGRMKNHVELKIPGGLTPLLCPCCGGLMRLVGSEPHPVDGQTDLLTYNCTACEELLVLPVPVVVSEV
jgi:hypothetical protein